MLNVRNLSFAYNEDKIILDDISLDVQKGEVLGILGPNGTGKTTFIKCLNQILKPTNGTVFFNNQDMSNLSQKEIAKFVAYVPQYTDSFFPMTVVDMVMMGRVPFVGRNYTESDKQIVFDIMKKMNLEQFAFRSIQKMSGGERQRAFIARAMAQQPQMIILDEPTSSLDLYNQLFILHTVSDLAKKENIAIILTIHDLNLASMFCDKILMLKDTHIFAFGSAQEVLTEKNINAMYKVHTKVSLEENYKHIRLLKAL